jgi:integrase
VILNSHLLPRLGGLVLSRITAGDVQSFSDARLRASAAPATVYRELMVLSGLYREARKRELVDRNPVSMVKKPTVDNKIVRYLDQEEEKELLARLPEPLHSAVVVALHSGLRETEELNLTWADIRLKERAIVVRRTKSNRDRMVPMSETLFQLLSRMPRHIRSAYVFTNSETEDRYERFNNTTWRKALKDAGIKGFRRHDLRHTFCSRLAQAGVHPVAIKDLAGHSVLRVTARYMHLAPANLRAAVEVLDGPKTAPITTHGTTQQHVDTGKAVG